MKGSIGGIRERNITGKVWHFVLLAENMVAAAVGFRKATLFA